jgi:hypothetical protein
VVKIIGAVFGASALKTHPEYVGIGLAYKDMGMGFNTLLSLALAAANLNTPQSLVSQLWFNVMHQAGSDVQLQPFLQMLSAGTASVDLAAMAANAPQNLTSINLVGLASTGVVYV